MADYWVIDGHCDSLIDYVDGLRTLNNPQEGGHWDLVRGRQGNLKLQFLAAFIETKYKPERAIVRGLELIQGAHKLLKSNQDSLMLIKEKKDLDLLFSSNKMGVLLSVEGGEILGNHLFLLDTIYELGVRALGLTWNQRNAIGDGVGESTQGSLTKFGEEVIGKMNDLGMIVDVSHLNEAGFWHVLKISTQPIIASHSCAYALCPHPRNLTDAQLKELAEKGGIVGVNFYPEFLVGKGEANLEDVITHIKHIVKIAGINSVALGSDYDGIEATPSGLEDVGKFGNLAISLQEAGFTQEEIEKIM
ncbi:MAG: membrane dipeptidase, partial [Desulfitobacterium sp.]|nr:membrane dipeptidase [Desulfitobacterium sp.]